MYETFNLLNQYQKDAVMNDDRFLLLNAGVGSGKTTVLVNKVLYLFREKKVPLSDMVVLTFTNKAAEEIKERVLSFDGQCIDRRELALFGTFHSAARYLLAVLLPVEELGYTKDFTVIDPNGIDELVDSIINRYGLNIKYRKKLEKRLSQYKSGRTLYGNMKYTDEIDRLINIFEEEKLKRNVMDFDDLVKNAEKLLKSGEFKPSWVIIDEFQDTDGMQLDMIDGLIGEKTHVFAVGDPNQVIYSWRGGSRDIFSTFKKRYGASEKSLPINYRSTGTIIQAARAFLDNPLSLEGIRNKGASITVKRHYNSFNEALYMVDVIKKLHEEGVEYKDIAIFYRMQKQSDVFEDVFKREGIPFEVSVRKTLRDIPALYFFVKLIKASLNDRDIDSLLYVMSDNRYGSGLSQKEVSKLIKGDKTGKSRVPVLVEKIRNFREWCGGVDSENCFEDGIYNYFDMDNYLSPTSISYEEDKNMVMKYLKDLGNYIKINGFGFIEGIRNSIDYTALYGNGIIKEMIDTERNSVKLMTLHGSKGLEFKYVFISGANTGIIPLGGRYDDEEEKRLFFVGITRAMDYLEISYHSNPEDYKALPVMSPYIRMIPAELIESDEQKSRAGNLSILRREIKNNMDGRTRDKEQKKILVNHPKYGDGHIVSEDGDNYVVHFDNYGEKSFSKLFCSLKFYE